jgi:hypothetical protein
VKKKIVRLTLLRKGWVACLKSDIDLTCYATMWGTSEEDESHIWSSRANKVVFDNLEFAPGWSQSDLLKTVKEDIRKFYSDHDVTFVVSSCHHVIDTLPAMSE